MIFYIKKIVPVFLATVLSVGLVNAQMDVPKFEIGAGFSGYVYLGDLTPNQFGAIETMRLGVQLHGSLILSPSFMARTNIEIGGLRADDAVYENPELRRQRNFSFKTPLLELSELLVWNPFKSNYKDKGFSPYLMAGIGVSFLDIQTDRSKFNPDYFTEGPLLLQYIAEDEAHGTPGAIPIFPVGAGVRYAFSPALSIYAESIYRIMSNDYLDGFSKAVNPEGGDHYQSISVGVIYRPGGSRGKLGCPSVSY